MLKVLVAEKIPQNQVWRHQRTVLFDGGPDDPRMGLPLGCTVNPRGAANRRNHRVFVLPVPSKGAMYAALLMQEDLTSFWGRTANLEVSIL